MRPLHPPLIFSMPYVRKQRRCTAMVLENNNHSVFPLHYHLIFVVKYRHKAIDDAISTRLKEIFEYIQLSYNITLQEWNHDQVHILFSAHPKTELTKFINAYKSASCRLIKRSSRRYGSSCRKSSFGVVVFALSVWVTLQSKCCTVQRKPGER